MDRAADTENALASDPKMRAPLLAKLPIGRAAQPDETAERQIAHLEVYQKDVSEGQGYPPPRAVIAPVISAGV